MPDLDEHDPNAVVSHEFSSNESFTKQLDAEEYWTEERMAQAVPFELKADNPEEGPPDDVTVKAPDAPRVRSGGNKSADMNLFSDDISAANFATQRVGGLTEFPYRAVGKLFARIGGADRTGTAFVVGERCLFTAGHCIYPGPPGLWADRVAFAPAYRQGADRRLWTAASLHTLAGWTVQRSDARAYDIGGIILSQPIDQATGKIGWYANLPPNIGSFHSVGYPNQWISPQYPFDGRTMWRCAGGQVSAGRIQTMANNMSEGASGGPWLIERNGMIYANGVNSYRRSDQPERLSSPYFGEGVINMMRRLEA